MHPVLFDALTRCDRLVVAGRFPELSRKAYVRVLWALATILFPVGTRIAVLQPPFSNAQLQAAAEAVQRAIDGWQAAMDNGLLALGGARFTTDEVACAQFIALMYILGINVVNHGRPMRAEIERRYPIAADWRHQGAEQWLERIAAGCYAPARVVLHVAGHGRIQCAVSTEVVEELLQVAYAFALELAGAGLSPMIACDERVLDGVLILVVPAAGALIPVAAAGPVVPFRPPAPRPWAVAAPRAGQAWRRATRRTHRLARWAAAGLGWAVALMARSSVGRRLGAVVGVVVVWEMRSAVFGAIRAACWACALGQDAWMLAVAVVVGLWVFWDLLAVALWVAWEVLRGR